MVVRRRRTSATEEANRIFEQSDKNQVSVVRAVERIGTVLLGGYEGYQIHFLSHSMQYVV